MKSECIILILLSILSFSCRRVINDKQLPQLSKKNGISKKNLKTFISNCDKCKVIDFPVRGKLKHTLDNQSFNGEIPIDEEISFKEKKYLFSASLKGIPNIIIERNQIEVNEPSGYKIPSKVNIIKWEESSVYMVFEGQNQYVPNSHTGDFLMEIYDFRAYHFLAKENDTLFHYIYEDYNLQNEILEKSIWMKKALRFSFPIIENPLIMINYKNDGCICKPRRIKVK